MTKTNVNKVLPIILSLYIVFHLTSVLLYPNPGSVLYRYMEPLISSYGNQFGFNTTWQFFSPNPGSLRYVEYSVIQDRKQIRWLESSLKNSTAKWKIVYGHHTLWSAGGGKFTEARALRQLIGPIICKYADAYFAGHEHELEINTDSCLKETGTSKHPLPLIISGAGAKQRPVHHPFQSYQEIRYPQYKAIWSKGMVWGFTHVEIAGDEMIIKMITTPDSGSGKANHIKTVKFKNRSEKLANYSASNRQRK